MINQHTLEGVSNDDEQLRCEIRAIADLLLDIYEHRARKEKRLKSDVGDRRLDADCPHLNIEERSQ